MNARLEIFAGASALMGAANLSLNSIRLKISGSGTRAEFHGAVTLEAGDLDTAENTTSVFHGPVRRSGGARS